MFALIKILKKKYIVEAHEIINDHKNMIYKEIKT
jgi:hypothetical protein